jgi:hydrogenase maturation protein HypF
MLARRFNTPLTSSAGRLFDAVAAIATGRTKAAFEGQLAMQLEWLAGECPSDETYPWAFETGSDGAAIVDTRPLIRAVAHDVRRGLDARRIAGRFHVALANVIVDMCVNIRDQTGVKIVVLTGGVFMNAVLTRLAVHALQENAFTAYRHEKVPPNDGGVSLGQLAIAAAALKHA